MKKKSKLSFLALIILLIFSSCAQRRIDYLENRRDTDKFNSMEDYLSWYYGLEGPCKLVFSDQKEKKSLSQEEMIEDFNYLFNQIRDNYPFFGVLKRQYGIDFLGNYSTYLNEVKFCKNEQEFERTMEKIISDLRNDHANIADKKYVEETLNYYSHFWKDPSMYYEFLAMNKESVRNRYQIKGVQSSESLRKNSMKKSQFKEKTGENIETKVIEKDLGLIKVKEMLAEYELSDDMKKLDDFLDKNQDLKAIIIDIRGNSGGNSEYWQKYLLPRLIDKKVSVTNHMFFKGGMRSRLLLESEELGFEKIDNVNLEKMDLEHREDLKDFSYYNKDIIEIYPKKEKEFKGNLYLLVDDGVYSAAEGMANFCKNSKTAKLLGQKTGGDGITLGIINDICPNSGLVFTYTNTLGYSSDGTINEEEKTSPDINTESFNESIDVVKKLEKIGR